MSPAASTPLPSTSSSSSPPSPPLPPPTRPRKVTVETLRRMKARGARVVFLTAYDYPTAVFADRAGVDMLLVGDSAAMTVLGQPNTVGITLEEMLTFSRAVCRGAGRAFVVGDMPFLSYQPSDARAIRSAGAFIVAGCNAVKCEGGKRMARRVRAMSDAGIAVMGHVGLTPQAMAQVGGYRIQGKTPAAAQRVLDDAKAIEDAGAFAVLLEALPPEAGAMVREGLTIPVYGIGAGPHMDGQLVISHDLLGSFVGTIAPRFVSRYANVDQEVERAFRAYATNVRAGMFPRPEHCYPAEESSWRKETGAEG